MTNEPEPNTRAGEAFDPPCTDCDDTGIAFQTERACTCDAASRPLPQPSELVPRDVAESWKAKAENYQIERAELLADISDMMANHVENWPSPQKLKTAVALIDKTFHAQSAQIAKLQADGDKLAGALKRSRTGWANVLELGLLPVTHEDTALDLGMEATQALTEWEDRA